jgi:Flp pilus assembly pilin Flp
MRKGRSEMGSLSPKRWSSERGQTLVEYALVISLVSLATAILLMFQIDVVALYDALVNALIDAFG